MELMYSIFTHSNVFTWKQFLKKNFEVQSRGTRFLGILCDSRNFPKKSQKITNRPLGVGHVAESTQTNFFLTLGSPCGENEPYTSLVRPFLMILYIWEISLFQADFPKTAFSVIYENVTSWGKNQKNQGNHFSHEFYF